MAAFAILVAGILIAGIGVWLFIEDEKTSQSASDRFESLDRKLSHLESKLNEKLSKHMRDLTEAIQQDLKKPSPPVAPPITEPIEIVVKNPVRFIPYKRAEAKPKLPPLPKTLVPKKSKTSER